MPGSLIKLLDTMVLLENRLLHPDKPFECRGWTDPKLTPGLLQGQPMHCSHPHGMVTLSDAIAVSCNAYFANAISKISPAQFQRMWQLCFPKRPLEQSPTQATLFAYALGCSPQANLSAGDLLDWMRFIAKPDTTKTTSHPEISPELQAISPNTWGMLRHAMRGAARWGTGKNADQKDRYQLALKTGTTRRGKLYQSWAAGFYPFDSPSHIFCVRAFSGTSEATAIPALRNYFIKIQTKGAY